MSGNQGKNTGSKGKPGWQPTDPRTLPGMTPPTVADSLATDMGDTETNDTSSMEALNKAASLLQELTEAREDAVIRGWRGDDCANSLEEYHAGGKRYPLAFVDEGEVYKIERMDEGKWDTVAMYRSKTGRTRSLQVHGPSISWD